jgi:hypothetical protein
MAQDVAASFRRGHKTSISVCAASEIAATFADARRSVYPECQRISLAFVKKDRMNHE